MDAYVPVGCVILCLFAFCFKLTDTTQVYDDINSGRRGDVVWPNEDWRTAGGRTGWHGWSPSVGDEGSIVHRWIPSHRDSSRRSHVDKTVILVHIDDKFVPVAESGLTFLGVEV